MIHKLGRLALALAVVSIYACGTADEEAGPRKESPAHPKTEVIGPDGGTIEYEGLTLIVPAGALSEDVEIELTKTGEAPAGEFTRLSPVFKFEPEGLQFAAPVSVRMPFTGTARDPGMYWASAGDPFQRIGGAVEDGAVVAEVSHFSQGFVGDLPEPGEGGGLRPTAHRAWPRRGGDGSFEADQIAASSDGGVFVSGRFSGAVDFGGNSPDQSQGAALVHYGKDGALRWARFDLDWPDKLHGLAGGDVLVGGHKNILRIGSDGKDVWSVGYGKGNGRFGVASMAVGADGNIAIVGGSNGPVDFGGGPLTSLDAAFVILGSDGKHVFSKSFAAGEFRHVVAVDGGYVVSGLHSNAVDFGGGELPASAVPGSSFDVHLVRFAAKGDHVWSVALGPKERAELYPVTLTASGGSVALAASYNRGEIDVGDGPISTDPLRGVAVFTFELADGKRIDTKAFTGPHIGTANLASADGRLYVTGNLQKAADFGGGLLLDGQEMPDGGFVAVLGPNGSHHLSAAWPSILDTSEPIHRIHRVEGLQLVPDGSGGMWWLAYYDGAMELEGVALPEATDRNALLMRFD